MDPAIELRRRRALEAATAIARLYGVTHHAAYVLKDSNNTIVHLAPSTIVAKVGTTTIRADAGEVLARELEIGAHLARHGAPVAPPTSAIPPGPHRYGAMTVTCWSFRPKSGERRLSHGTLAVALRRLHDAFADYPGALPSLTDVLDGAGRVIADPSSTPELPPADRSFLEAASARIAHRIRGLHLPAATPLHGDPHLDGNVLVTAAGPIFVDFEGACTGPPEWDLTALPREVAMNYGGADIDLADQLREARSLAVTAWCWMHPDRSPEIEEAAHFHLNVLKAAVGA